MESGIITGEAVASPQIDEAIAAVYAEVGYVTKTPSAELKYSYASEAELIAALRPAMVKAGITVHVDEIKLLHHEIFETSRGTKMNHMLVSGTVAFMARDGSRRFVAALGEGSDSGDKAIYKAMTGMYKYALRQTFCIETGDDPDKHSSADMERAGVTLAEVREISKGLSDAKFTGKGDTYSKPKVIEPKPASELAPTPSRWASGRKIGTVEREGDQLMIECPEHGWSRAREFVAMGDRPARIKCTRNSGTREMPNWCTFGVSPDGEAPEKYAWIPAYNELMKVNGDVVSLRDIGTVIGQNPPSFNAIDRWLFENSDKDIYTLFEEASEVHELELASIADKDLPFDD